MSNESSSSKRPRWTVNPEACLVCRKRKSRCRVISASGACERCRELSQRCSLQHSDVLGNIANSDELDISIPAEGSHRGPDLMAQVDEHRRLLVRLDHRTKDLLDIVRAQSGSQYTERRRPIHTQDGLGREFSGTREDGIGDDDDIEEGIQEMLTRRLGTSLLYVTGMNLHDRTSFVDPVGAGLISETGIESVFERFHECMDKISPMGELMGDLVDSKHPFLRSCVLPYLTFMRSNNPEDHNGHLRAQSILNDNLDRLSSSNPAVPIITGLVILSLSPTNGFENRYSRQVDGFGHIGRAVDMALADGLDDNALIGLRQPPSELAHEPALHLLKSKVMLWYLVAHRAAWVEILTSPSLSARPFLAPAFSAVFPTKIPHSPLLVHLYHESRLLTLLGTLTANFRRARQTSAFDVSQLQGLQSDLREYRAGVLSWQHSVEKDDLYSGPFLVFNSLIVEILLLFKITTDCVTRAPSPLGPGDKFAFFRDCLKDLRARAVDCIAHATATNMDLGVLPAFHLTLAFLPFKVLRAASQIDPAGSGEMFRTGAVAQYRAMLCSSHALGASMVAHIENHVPSRSWEHLVDTLETGQLADDHNDGPDEFADLFRAMCESDAFLDFRYQS